MRKHVFVNIIWLYGQQKPVQDNLNLLFTRLHTSTWELFFTEIVWLLINEWRQLKINMWLKLKR